MATRETKLPSIPDVPDNLNEDMVSFLSSIKEIIEIREGNRANILDKTLLRSDLRRIGIDVRSLINEPASYSLSNLIANANDDHYAKFTSTGLKKKTFAEVLADLSGEAGAAFDFNSQNLTNVGTMGLVGGQIAFPATAVPSADANTLDDYEEGTWTPTLEFSDQSVDMAYTVRAGLYRKVGNLVFCSGRILLSSKGSSNGNAQIKALPFTILNNDGAYGVSTIAPSVITFANVWIGQLHKTLTYITLSEVTEAGVLTTLTDANFANNSDIQFTAIYITA